MWREVPDDVIRAPQSGLRTPAALWLLAASAGIVLDQQLSLPVPGWLTLAVLSLGLVGSGRLSPAVCNLLLGLGWAAIFGSWHHQWAAEPPVDQIYHWSTTEGQLLTLRGSSVSSAWVKPRDRQEPLVQFDLDVTEIVQPDGTELPLRGRVRVQSPLAEGTDPVVVQAGDNWQLTGRLTRPATAGNPGDFDYRHWLRTQQVTALLRVRHTDMLERRPSRPGVIAQLRRFRDRLRRQAQESLQATLPAAEASVAEAILLGTRTQMPTDIRAAFLASGILHMLAISGINVAVIWGAAIRLCRAVRLPYSLSCLVVIVILQGYVWLTSASPPIVRAATCASFFQLAALSGRRVSLFQVLSLAAMAVLALNPTDLFQPAAWLSFLSVGVLSAVHRWCESWLPAWWANWQELQWAVWQNPGTGGLEDDPLAASLPAVIVWSFRGLEFFVKGTVRTTAATTAIWLTTLPLVATQFHQISIIGILLNVVLAPCFLALLVVGYAWLFTSWLAPWASMGLLWLFGQILELLLGATRWPQQSGFTPWYLGGWPEWWLVGYFLGLLWWWQPPRWWTARVRLRASCLWILLGLTIGLWPAKPAGLVCDVLSVGHGLAIVFQGPQGRTLVYDAGSLAGAEIAAESISQNLWQSQQRRIDALVISHADADHCNAVPELTQRLQVGTLFVHPTMAASLSPTAQAVFTAWEARGARWQLLSAGDRLNWEADVGIHVWLPTAETCHPKDNANSLVIAVEYAGRRILLTGDLEREGLADLLNQPRQPVDILIAPHHGSPTANTPELGAWTHPTFAVLSSSDTSLDSRLQSRYPPDTVLLNTAVYGRIRFVIRPDGVLLLERHRQPEQAIP